MGGIVDSDNPYANRKVINHNRNIIYVTQPGTILVPQNEISNQMIPIIRNPNGRIIYVNSSNMPNNEIRMNHSPPNYHIDTSIQNQNQKRTISNLRKIFGEINFTKNILDKNEQKKCSICLEDFKIGTKIIYLPCFHFYHSKCIEQWIKNSNKCPLCKNEIVIP